MRDYDKEKIKNLIKEKLHNDEINFGDSPPPNDDPDYNAHRIEEGLYVRKVGLRCRVYFKVLDYWCNFETLYENVAEDYKSSEKFDLHKGIGGEEVREIRMHSGKIFVYYKDGSKTEMGITANL